MYRRDCQYTRHRLAARCSGAEVRLLAFALFGMCGLGGFLPNSVGRPEEEWSAPSLPEEGLSSSLRPSPDRL
ncbi:hypothetical protein N431DRAFT_24448 [Stipitochalara longipes BDJ]|nr:hypothetical protein N431DRAFT_24448 [Stipitochalara longipes BDJ]